MQRGLKSVSRVKNKALGGTAEAVHFQITPRLKPRAAAFGCRWPKGQRFHPFVL